MVEADEQKVKEEEGRVVLSRYLFSTISVLLLESLSAGSSEGAGVTGNVGNT